MRVRVTRHQYEKRVYINGVEEKRFFRDGTEDPKVELVSGSFLEGWLKSAEWFDRLVAETGQPAEKHEKLSGGVIKVTQFNPEGVEYVTIFTPVRRVT